MRKLHPYALEALAQTAFASHLRSAKPSVKDGEAVRLWRESSQARAIWTGLVPNLLAAAATLDAAGALYLPEATNPEAVPPAPSHALALHRVGGGKAVAGHVAAILAGIRHQQGNGPKPAPAHFVIMDELSDLTAADYAGHKAFTLDSLPPGITGVDYADIEARATAPDARLAGGRLVEIKTSGHAWEPTEEARRAARNRASLIPPTRFNDLADPIFPDDPRPDPNDKTPEGREAYRNWKARNFGRIYGAPYTGSHNDPRVDPDTLEIKEPG